MTCPVCKGTRIEMLGPGMARSCPLCSPDPKPPPVPTTQGSGNGPVHANAKHDRFPDSSISPKPRP
jgi:hypothetical protein